MSPAFRLRPALLGVLVLLGGMARPTAARADDAKPPPSSAAVEEGRAHFTRGVSLFHDGDARAALVEFKRAYEVAPNYRILYNLGETELELRDYVEALRAFKLYLKEGGMEIPEARRTEVETEVTRLEPRVGELVVELTVPGADVTVDDVPQGKSPIAPLKVNAGRHRVSAVIQDYAPIARVVEIAGGEHAKVSLPMVLLRGERSAADSVTNVPFWAGLITTGALAVGTAVVGGLAVGAQSDLRGAADTFPTTTDAIDRARTKVRTLALVADVLGGATLVAGGVTLYFGLTGKSAAQEKARVGIGPGSLVVERRF
jgi:hypothetical protein